MTATHAVTARPSDAGAPKQRSRDRQRLQRRTTFAYWLATQLENDGKIDPDRVTAVAEATGVQPTSVRAWLSGQTLPAIQRLAPLAAAVSADLAEVCELAGRPLVEALRAAFARDPHTSLTGVLRRWQDDAGYDAAAAAAATGVSRFDWSRYVCGSRTPLWTALQRLADGTGFDLVYLTGLAYPGDDAESVGMVHRAIAFDAPAARLLRHVRQPHMTVDQLAAAAGLGRSTVVMFEAGERVPDVDEAAALSRVLPISRPHLLVACGLATQDAFAIHDDLTAAARSQQATRVAGGQLLRRHRLRTGVRWQGMSRQTSGRTAAEVAAQAGLERSFVSKVEAGTKHPSIVQIRQLADAVGVERHLLLAAFDAA